MYEVAEIQGKGKGLIAKCAISVNETRSILVISDPMLTIVDTKHLETVCYCCYEQKNAIGTVGEWHPLHYHIYLDRIFYHHWC